MKSYKLIACAFLAAIAFILQVPNEILGYPTGFGMTVDLAAVPVMLALFIFGAEYSFLILMALGAMIMFFAPTGAVGSVMKVGATLPMVLVPYYIAKSKTLADYFYVAVATFVGVLLLFYVTTSIYPYINSGLLEYMVGIIPIAVLFGLFYYASKDSKYYAKLSDLKVAILALILAIILRGAVATISNLYFAGPVFYHMPPEEFITILNSLEIPLLGKGMGWFVIFFWNAMQGAVEFAIAWILAFRFGLAKRYGEE